MSTWQIFDNSELPGPRIIAKGERDRTTEVVQSDIWESLVRQWA
jgi:hypothetical protein